MVPAASTFIIPNRSKAILDLPEQPICQPNATKYPLLVLCRIDNSTNWAGTNFLTHKHIWHNKRVGVLSHYALSSLFRQQWLTGTPIKFLLSNWKPQKWKIATLVLATLSISNLISLNTLHTLCFSRKGSSVRKVHLHIILALWKSHFFTEYFLITSNS